MPATSSSCSGTVLFAGTVALFFGLVAPLLSGEPPEKQLKLRTIDASRVGQAQPDSSAAADVDGDREPEVFSSMQNKKGHPEVFLYDRNGQGKWNRTTIGRVKIKEEIEWVAVGTPFPGDHRYAVAVSVQHKKDGLVVFSPRKQGRSPHDPETWQKQVAKDFAGQGLRFKDLDGDLAEELVYATQAGKELGVLDYVPSAESGNHWQDDVIDSENGRAWWWLDGKFYDLNRNGFHRDFFVSTRMYGGRDTGIWKVTQENPGDLSSYQVQKVYDGNALHIDTGYIFSEPREGPPDIVMVDKNQESVFLLDGRNDFEVTRVPLDGAGWNVKILPSLGPDHSRDSFVVATADSSSLFWSFRWNDGAYEVRHETGFLGNYGHPLDGTFTIADVDRDGVLECVVPDSASSGKSKGLGYLDPVSTSQTGQRKPSRQIELNQK